MSCTIDWSAVADWATLGVAVIALVMWRVQLRGGTKHQAANEIAEAAGTLRYAFYDARSPMLLAWEFPATYRLRPTGAPVTNHDKADEYRHVFHNRFKELWIHIVMLAKLRARAGALLGDSVADAVEQLAKKTRELDDLMADYVKQLRDGPEAVALWGDQAYVSRVKDCTLATRETNDAYSQEFETRMRSLSELLKRYM